MIISILEFNSFLLSTVCNQTSRNTVRVVRRHKLLMFVTDLFMIETNCEDKKGIHRVLHVKVIPMHPVCLIEIDIN